MKIIKIECPACGATPEVDKDFEFGYCQYCGTKIYIPNAVQKIRGTVGIDKTNEIENLLKRARRFEDAGELGKAYEYYERVLDIDADNETALRQRPFLQVKIARAYEKQGRIPEAEQTLRRAMNLYPQHKLLRSEFNRISRTVYKPNVTIINRTKDVKPIYEVQKDGKKKLIADVPANQNAGIKLIVQMGTHTFVAGTSSNKLSLTINNPGRQLYVIIDSKLFGCTLSLTDHVPEYRQETAPPNPKRLRCPKCGSDDISVQIVMTGAETEKHLGLMGRINNTARGITAFSTLGMSNIFWKKAEPKEKHKALNQKVCICQDCGHSWEKKD